MKFNHYDILTPVTSYALIEFKQSRLQEFISKPELLSTAQASNDSSLTSMTQSNGESPILITWDPARNPNDVGKVAEILFECGMNGHSSISLAQGYSEKLMIISKTIVMSFNLVWSVDDRSSHYKPHNIMQ
jgi:hypothetical protein